MGVDDQRAAVGMSVTLSGQLIGAALAMLAAQGGYLAYALSERVLSGWFFLVSLGAAVCFIGSIVAAGKAVTAARNAGFEGCWSLEDGKGLFNGQAILCLLGLALLGGMLLLSGQPQEDALTKNYAIMIERQTRVEDELSAIKGEVARQQEKISGLAAEIRRMEARLEREEVSCKARTTPTPTAPGGWRRR